ncbi:MAG TPA: crossover junction endodeoxyribonuclease RuvC [Actinomycetaceae bacterium]|nr:crossover junction endodeoxyribonuclease RuvC [Actinomycetaceae bacterium]
MRILGVDPGLTRCGVGVIETGRPPGMVSVGVLRTEAGTPVAERLLAISRGLGEWMDMHSPDAVAIERAFAQHNVPTVMGVAQVSGLAMVAAAERGIPIGLHTPSEVKASVTGYGNAPKAQVQSMVARILCLSEAPKPADAADALALAICHFLRAGSPTSSATGAETPAQRAWAAAERAARRPSNASRGDYLR